MSDIPSQSPNIPPLPQVRLPDPARLIVNTSPHVHAKRSSIPRIMFLVILALLPAVISSIYYFGWRALAIILVTTLSTLVGEAIANLLLRQSLTIGDGSAAVTGLLLALTFPVQIPLWVCILGGIIAIGLGKMVYGGIGSNPFNPALVGRVALLIALPTIMTTWTKPNLHSSEKETPPAIQVVTCATPLASQKSSVYRQHVVVTSATAKANQGKKRENLLKEPNYSALFWGKIPGTIGETNKGAILLGGILLLLFSLIRWQIPVFYLGTVALISAIAHAISPMGYPDALSQLLSGGLFFAAFFMATDMVTTPITRKGATLFAIGCGVITSVIRFWGSYPEGVTFAILLMNALTPLIDRLTSDRPFGRELRKTKYAIAKEVRS